MTSRDERGRVGERGGVFRFTTAILRREHATHIINLHIYLSDALWSVNAPSLVERERGPSVTVLSLRRTRVRCSFFSFVLAKCRPTGLLLNRELPCYLFLPKLRRKKTLLLLDYHRIPFNCTVEVISHIIFNSMVFLFLEIYIGKTIKMSCQLAGPLYSRNRL